MPHKKQYHFYINVLIVPSAFTVNFSSVLLRSHKFKPNPLLHISPFYAIIPLNIQDFCLVFSFRHFATNSKYDYYKIYK